jgi:hypothetical protein
MIYLPALTFLIIGQTAEGCLIQPDGGMGNGRPALILYMALDNSRLCGSAKIRKKDNNDGVTILHFYRTY